MAIDKSSLSALSGDPRRPDSAVPFKRPAPAEDKVDVLSTAGMILGMVGMLTKVRLFSFIALAFIASSFIQRGPDTDTKQLIMSGMFSLVGIFFSHLQPPGAASSAANATQAAAASAASAAAAAAAGAGAAGQAA